MSVFGGSLTQFAAPALSAVLFFRQPDFFAVTVAGVWLSTAMYELAVYVEDALTMTLPLLSMADEAYHDWNYLLTSMNLIQWDQTIAKFLRFCASGLMITSMAAGIWIIWKIARLQSKTA